MSQLQLARDLGADVAFLEAIESPEQVQAAVKQLAPMPVLVNLIPNGKTPAWTLTEVSSWGVKLAIYPFLAVNPAIHAVREAYRTLQVTGKDDEQAKGYSPRDFFDVMGLAHEESIDKAAGGDAFEIAA